MHARTAAPSVGFFSCIQNRAVAAYHSSDSTPPVASKQTHYPPVHAIRLVYCTRTLILTIPLPVHPLTLSLLGRLPVHGIRLVHCTRTHRRVGRLARRHLRYLALGALGERLMIDLRQPEGVDLLCLKRSWTDTRSSTHTHETTRIATNTNSIKSFPNTIDGTIECELDQILSKH